MQFLKHHPKLTIIGIIGLLILFPGILVFLFEAIMTLIISLTILFLAFIGFIAYKLHQVKKQMRFSQRPQKNYSTIEETIITDVEFKRVDE